jgi:aspartyl-tRNA(Asn)/glutamyl-tRNA(Gln) amidotransferase subunit C
MQESNRVEHIDVRYVADLARIELTPDEEARYGQELDAVLAYVEQLSRLDVDGIEPTAHAAPVTNVLREDVAGDSLPAEAVLANAPDLVDETLIRVPVVIEEESVG